MRSVGDMGTALSLVNEVRGRAGASALTEINYEILLAERGRELYAEGYRRSDMIRFGVYLNERWVSAAATFDRTLCKKNDLPTVEFDGKKDAILPDKDLMGKTYIEYIDKFPPVDDLPFDWIAQRISKIVGPDKRPWLDKSHIPSGTE